VGTGSETPVRTVSRIKKVGEQGANKGVLEMTESRNG